MQSNSLWGPLNGNSHLAVYGQSAQLKQTAVCCSHKSFCFRTTSTYVTLCLYISKALLSIQKVPFRGSGIENILFLASAILFGGIEPEFIKFVPALFQKGPATVRTVRPNRSRNKKSMKYRDIFEHSFCVMAKICNFQS